MGRYGGKGTKESRKRDRIVFDRAVLSGVGIGSVLSRAGPVTVMEGTTRSDERGLGEP